MKIDSSIISELSERLKTIEDKYGYFSYLIKERFANEKLIQLEIMRIISLRPEVVEYLPEKLYPDSKKKCDFWFRTIDNKENWMEIKTRPTNYKNPKHAKAITDGIEGIVEDINRLREKTPAEAETHISFSLYPVYSDSYPFLNRHLEKISMAAGKTVNKPDIEIHCKNGAFQLYLLNL